MRAIIVLIAVLFLLHFANPVSAATFTFEGSLAEIHDDESFTINVLLSIASSKGKSYYIRPGFFQPEKTPRSYFGYIKDNAGDWANGGSPIDKTQFYKITMNDNNEWVGSLIIKADLEASGFNGSGNYNFIIGRYTESGSTVNWCDGDSTPCSTSIITINQAPTPTSTPTPTPTSLPAPTKTPTPTPSRTPTPILRSSLSPAPEEVLGESTETGEIVSATDTESSNEDALASNKSKSTNNNWFQKFFIWIGGILLIACAILSFRVYIKNRKPDSETI